MLVQSYFCTSTTNKKQQIRKLVHLSFIYKLSSSRYHNLTVRLVSSLTRTKKCVEKATENILENWGPVSPYSECTLLVKGFRLIGRMASELKSLRETRGSHI